MPGKTVSAHRHVVTLGKTDKVVSTAIAEAVARGLQGVPLHFVLCHQHVKLLADLLCLTEVFVVKVVFPHGDGRTDFLSVFVSIIAQGVLVGGIVDSVIIERSHGADGLLRIIRVVGICHFIVGHEPQDKN